MVHVEAKGPLPLSLQDWAAALYIGWCNKRKIESADDKDKSKEPPIQPKPCEPAAAEAESSAGVEHEEDPSAALTEDDMTKAQSPPSDINSVGFTPINRDSPASVEPSARSESDTDDEERHVASMTLVALHRGTSVVKPDDDGPAVISGRRPP